MYVYDYDYDFFQQYLSAAIKLIYIYFLNANILHYITIWYI